MSRIKPFFLLTIFVVAMCAFGCGNEKFVEIQDLENHYGREYVEGYKTSIWYGWQLIDDTYVMLDYLYNDETVKEELGDTFEITMEDVVCPFYESGPRHFLKGYEGEADYVIRIDDRYFEIKVSKNYGEKWKVDECFEVEEEEWLPSAD